MKYIVTEIQEWANGSVQTPCYAYDTENAANAKYHQILAAAAVSELPMHTAIMYQSDGHFIKGERFIHEVTEVES